jgi:hypothetical protein
VKDSEGGSGCENENVFDAQPVAAEEQKSGGGGLAAESAKGKRGGWLSQSVDLSNMSR